MPSRNGGRDPRRPRHGGMSDEGDRGMLAHQPVKVGQARDHRRDHDGIDAGAAGGGDLPAHGVEVAREARHIAHGPAAAGATVRNAAATASTRSRKGE